MDDKIRDLCRSNLRENLKNIKLEQEDDEILEIIKDEEAPDADVRSQGSSPELEEEIYQIIQDALKRKEQADIVSLTATEKDYLKIN